MGIKSFFKNIGALFKVNKREGYRNEDRVLLNLDGLEIRLQRGFSYDMPHEVTIVVPRAEFRKRIWNGNHVEEYEIILNSITIVHAPLRPPIETKSHRRSSP
jgi:hypothetical protein